MRRILRVQILCQEEKATKPKMSLLDDLCMTVPDVGEDSDFSFPEEGKVASEVRRS